MPACPELCAVSCCTSSSFPTAWHQGEPSSPAHPTSNPPPADTLSPCSPTDRHGPPATSLLLVHTQLTGPLTWYDVLTRYDGHLQTTGGRRQRRRAHRRRLHRCRLEFRRSAASSLPRPGARFLQGARSAAGGAMEGLQVRVVELQSMSCFLRSLELALTCRVCTSTAGLVSPFEQRGRATHCSSGAHRRGPWKCVVLQEAEMVGKLASSAPCNPTLQPQGAIQHVQPQQPGRFVRRYDVRQYQVSWRRTRLRPIIRQPRRRRRRARHPTLRGTRKSLL